TRVLSRVLALAAISSIARASPLPIRLMRTSWRTSLSSIPASKCSYHASRLPIPAARRIRSRYSLTPSMTTARRSAGETPASPPLDRPGPPLAHPLDAHLLAAQLEQHPGLEVLVPRVQAPHPGGPAHPVPVFLTPLHDHGAAVGRREAAVAAHDLEAGREPF